MKHDYDDLEKPKPGRNRFVNRRDLWLVEEVEGEFPQFILRKGATSYLSSGRYRGGPSGRG